MFTIFCIFSGLKIWIFFQKRLKNRLKICSVSNNFRSLKIFVLVILSFFPNYWIYLILTSFNTVLKLFIFQKNSGLNHTNFTVILQKKLRKKFWLRWPFFSFKNFRNWKKVEKNLYHCKPYKSYEWVFIAVWLFPLHKISIKSLWVLHRKKKLVDMS